MARGAWPRTLSLLLVLGALFGTAMGERPRLLAYSTPSAAFALAQRGLRRAPVTAAPLVNLQRCAGVAAPPARRAVTTALFVPEGVHFHSWLGFLGGTCGVVGTLLTYESKRFKMKQRVQCPYCEGGVLTCGICLGEGQVQLAGTEGGAAASMITCPNCGGLGVRACVNCKGEGLSIPMVLQRKTPQIPVDEFELALEDLGIAAIAANYVNSRARQRLDREVERHAALIEANDKENLDKGAPQSWLK